MVESDRASGLSAFKVCGDRHKTRRGPLERPQRRMGAARTAFPQPRLTLPKGRSQATVQGFASLVLRIERFAPRERYEIGLLALSNSPLCIGQIFASIRLDLIYLSPIFLWWCVFWGGDLGERSGGLDCRWQCMQTNFLLPPK
jgi:hypothetical protein